MAFVLKSCILWQGRQLLPPCNMPPRRGGGLPPSSSGSGYSAFWGDPEDVASCLWTSRLRLFKSISSNPYHILRHYFWQREPSAYSLRPRTHSFALPAIDDRNVIPRLLYGVLTRPN